MEVGILQAISPLEKSFNSTGRLSIDGIPKNSVLDVKLASQSKQLALDLNIDQDDEGEIMLLAMILLQLHGVKLPSSEDESDLNKKKRQRTSPDQLAILEQIFQTDKMPNQQTRVQLADQLGMSSRRVQIWFQNKRAKVKRSVSKDGECPSPNSLNNSSSSISPPSSPSSPALAEESPVISPSPSPAISLNIPKQPLQPLDATNATTPTTIIAVPPPTTSTTIASTTITTPAVITVTVPVPVPVATSTITVAAPVPTPVTITTTAASTTHTPTIIDTTTKQLKAQQLQFSLTAPFAENQPVLTASY